MTCNHGLTNPDMPKAIARHEILCSLEDVVREGSLVLKPGGRFYMVHRPFRLVEIFQIFRQYRIEPEAYAACASVVDKEPNMVLIEGLENGAQ